MAKNPLIEELRNLGVTDYERRLLRELDKKLRASDIYNRAEDLNIKLLGQASRPASLSYETAVNAIKYGGYTARDLISEYKEEAKNVQSGTTSEYERYLEKLAEELEQIGVPTTVDNLRRADIGRVEYHLAEFRRYEAVGNDIGMEKHRDILIGLVG